MRSISSHFLSQLSWAFFTGCVGICLALIAFSWNRGLTVHDEGTILLAGWRAWQGEGAYRDFHYLYPPFTIMLTQVSFQLFGVSVAAARLLAALISLITLLVVWSLSRSLRLSVPLQGLALLAYTVWGPATYNFLWPTVLGLNFSLWTLRALFQKQYVWSGVLIGITILTKQNMGAALALALLISFWLEKTSWKDVARSIFGGSLVGVLFVAWLIHNDAFFPFLIIMKYYLLEIQIGTQGWYIAFLHFGSHLARIIKTIVYLLPLAIPFGVVFLTREKQRQVALLAFFLTLSNIYPLWDLVHISALFSLLCLVILTQISPLSLLPKLSGGFFVLILCGMGVWSTFGRGYYRWEAPLRKTTVFLSQPHGQIFVDTRTADRLHNVSEFIQDNTTSEETVFVYHYAPMLNFLLERNSPVSMLDMTHNMGSEKYQKMLVAELSEEKPRFMIAQREPENWGNPILAQYLLENYTLIQTLDELTIWERLEVNSRIHSFPL